jgi:DNA processing protein
LAKIDLKARPSGVKMDTGPVKFKKLLSEDLLGPLNDVERKHAPKSLYIAGDISLCKDSLRVSIIGTRQVSDEGKKRAQSLARMLVERKIVIVSGLARGVDTCAHQTAIDFQGKTIAVLGTPLDQFYPRENESLQKEIMERHLAISQFPPGNPIERKNFVIRNRTMALISHATIIVEAGDGSGTLHQGWEALRLGRPLFLLESLAKREDLKWPREMLNYGAQVLRGENIDILSEYLPSQLSGIDPIALPF